MKTEPPASIVLLTQASLALETGQYALAALQSGMAVEVGATTFVSDALKSAGWSAKARKAYEDQTMGRKLEIPVTDPRSLKTHCGSINGFSESLRDVKSVVLKLRNKVAHSGYKASHGEAMQAVKIAREFLGLVN